MCTVSQCPPSRSAASENRRVFAKCTKCAESTKCSIQSIVAYGAGEPHSLCKFHTGGGCLHNVHMLSLLNMKSSPNGRICEKCREIKRECVGFSFKPNAQNTFHDMWFKIWFYEKVSLAQQWKPLCLETRVRSGMLCELYTFCCKFLSSHTFVLY